MQHFARRQPPELLQSLILIVPHEGFLHLVLCKGKRGGSNSSIECSHYLQIYIVGKNINVGSTIVNPPLFFLGGVASQLLIFGPNSPHKSKRQIKTIQPQLNE